MVKVQDIKEVLGERTGRILDAAELAIPQEKFAVFRRFFLREMGNDGFLADVAQCLHGSARTGKDRNGTGRN